MRRTTDASSLVVSRRGLRRDEGLLLVLVTPAGGRRDDDDGAGRVMRAVPADRPSTPALSDPIDLLPTTSSRARRAASTRTGLAAPSTSWVDTTTDMGISTCCRACCWISSACCRSAARSNGELPAYALGCDSAGAITSEAVTTSTESPARAASVNANTSAAAAPGLPSTPTTMSAGDSSVMVTSGEPADDGEADVRTYRDCCRWHVGQQGQRPC